MIWDLPPPPKLWVPEKPAIVRAASLREVEATFPFPIGSPARTYATWDPTQKSANITLSANLLTVTTSAGSWSTVRATKSTLSKKWYWENTIQATGGTGVGFCNSSHAFDNYVGFYATGIGAFSGAGLWSNAINIVTSTVTWTTGDILNWALDMTGGSAAGKLWFGKAGTYFGGGDPAAGTTPTITTISGISGAMFPAASGNFTAVAANQTTTNFGGSPFSSAYSAAMVAAGWIGVY